MATSLLKQVYLFRDMSSDHLELLDKIAKIETYKGGERLFSLGDEASAMYVIQYGSVKVHQILETGEKVDIATLGAGSHFGEMPFLDGEPRSANIDVLETADILVLNYKELSELLKSKPSMLVIFYKSLSTFLCGRLRQTTMDLKLSRELNLHHF